MFGTEGNMVEQIVPDGVGKSQHDSTSFNGVGPSGNIIFNYVYDCLPNPNPNFKKGGL
jgi:hypothetical protein